MLLIKKVIKIFLKIIGMNKLFISKRKNEKVFYIFNQIGLFDIKEFDSIEIAKKNYPIDKGYTVIKL